jgi:hypothetical protein
MTLGCGSWGGNVTSDNVSPLHLLDIKRVAFEVRPVKSKRPAASASTVATPAPAPVYSGTAPTSTPTQPQAVSGSNAGKINREDIAAIVDRFLAGRTPEQPASEARQTRQTSGAASEIEVEAGSMYAGPGESRRQEETRPSGNGGRSASADSSRASSAASSGSAMHSANGNKTVDFVSEDDVRRAIQKGEKIYINAKTIITPAARDIGEPAEIFAKN